MATAHAALQGSPVEFPKKMPTEYPAGQQGDLVKLGEHLVRDTGTYAPGYVGNSLSCANCHLDNGTKPFAAPFVGLPGIFPLFSSREKTVISLQDRINGCFIRSMNGKPLPLDSKEMLAFIAYMGWISKDVPAGHEVIGRGFQKLDKPTGYVPDLAHGKQVFEDNCAVCHGADGQGSKLKDKVMFPPLWGAQSFNDGAGMSNPDNAAKFIQKNMPFTRPGTLTAQEAYDVANYVDSHQRPHFVASRATESSPSCHP
jgi:thiosulfate dehydrogenase